MLLQIQHIYRIGEYLRQFRTGHADIRLRPVQCSRFRDQLLHMGNHSMVRSTINMDNIESGMANR